MQWRWPAEREKWKELWGQYKYILMIVLAGMFLLLLPVGQTEKEQGSVVFQEQERFDLEVMEEKMERALSQIFGAGEVTVMLSLRESERQILASDAQQSEREQSSTTVVLSRGSGVEETVALQHIYPIYQGALVVCDGAGDGQVKLQITQAVRALTGLSTEKISVCKRQ